MFANFHACYACVQWIRIKQARSLRNGCPLCMHDEHVVTAALHLAGWLEAAYADEQDLALQQDHPVLH